VPDVTDRDRSIAAYAGEARAFHAFFGGVLIVLAGLHLFVLLPYLQLRTEQPLLGAALTAAEQEIVSTAEADKAAALSAAATAQFRRTLDAAPGDLQKKIGSLVARGRLSAGANGDPYKVSIRLPQDAGAGPVKTNGEESVTIEEAIRQQIGRQVEALGAAFDAALEPLRPLKTPPAEITDVVRTAEEGLGRNILALNEVLREAFAADPGFWERLEGTAGFARASTRAAEWTQGTADALRMLETRLAAAASTLKSRARHTQARVATLQERHGELRNRMTAFTSRLSWLPLGLDGWTRLYPLIAGALALTALFRLRRILLLRRALQGIDLDLMAPSWIVGASSAPGRWWAVILVALPVLAMLHAALAALRDPNLYTGILGEPSLANVVVYGALYAGLSAVGIWQLVLVGREIFARGPGRPGGLSSGRHANRGSRH
jgi:hypothetical protein